MILSRTFARGLAMLLFGIVLPLTISFKADQKFQFAQAVVTKASDNSYVMEVVRKTPEKLRTSSDYAIVALADSERANLAVMTNKQIMKMVVIYMGFAVMSFSMMFVVLGFTEGPVSVAGEGAGMRLDLKFGTIGAAIFVAGAAMSAAGGLLPNEYQTVGLPTFGGSSGKPAEQRSKCARITDAARKEACLLSLGNPPPQEALSVVK